MRVLNKNPLVYLWAGILALAGLAWGCNAGEKLPAADSGQPKMLKALFVTTGINASKGILPQGVTLAIQALNRQGVPVRLETREVLFDPEKLAEYNLLILSTSLGYHDADRRYSLSFMSDAELTHIRHFVESGGVLIAGDNVGRNLPDGTDRITMYQTLEPSNFLLSEVWGVSLSERNMKGFDTYGNITPGLEGYLREMSRSDLWTLVPEQVHSERAKVLANWVAATDTLPAIVENSFGQGLSYLLSTSDFLHPANEGGVWSAAQIEAFYQFVVDGYHHRKKMPLRLHPWPDAHPFAFCMSFNSEGRLEEYNRVFRLMEKEKVEPVFFVNGLVSEEIKDFLESHKVRLGSSGYSYENFRDLRYPGAIQDIQMNAYTWERQFEGFRFPFTSPGFWGVLALDKQGYRYESSIGADNQTFFHGSVFPYNIVASQDHFYQTTDILEVAPTYHDDYFFLKDVGETRNADPRKMVKDVQLYGKYLEDYWQRSVKPYQGVMVYLGHPAYVGDNDTTVEVLQELITQVKADNAWLTSIDELVSFRSGWEKLRFYVSTEKGKLQVQVSAPADLRVTGITLALDAPAEKVQVLSGEASLKGKFVVFDAFDGQVLRIE